MEWRRHTHAKRKAQILSFSITKKSKTISIINSLSIWHILECKKNYIFKTRGWSKGSRFKCRGNDGKSKRTEQMHMRKRGKKAEIANKHKEDQLCNFSSERRQHEDSDSRCYFLRSCGNHNALWINLADTWPRLQRRTRGEVNDFAHHYILSPPLFLFPSPSWALALCNWASNFTQALVKPHTAGPLLSISDWGQSSHSSMSHKFSGDADLLAWEYIPWTSALGPLLSHFVVLTNFTLREIPSLFLKFERVSH